MIRLGQAADAWGISRLLTQLEYPGTESFIASRLTTLLADPAEVFLVWAEPAGQIRAFLSLHFIPQIALKGDFARISYFAVDESARSHGIGAQLEAEATRLARERGCALIEVHCHTRRTRAHEFYARQGYAESPKYLIKKLS
jgi:GNAT superfamily N-acetyltransferase